MQWKTDSIDSLLSGIDEILLVQVGDQGSERTTVELVYSVKGSEEKLYVRGFVTEGEISDQNNAEVEMVEVSTNYSDGEDPADPAAVVARAYMKAALMKSGFQVVNSLEPYF